MKRFFYIFFLGGVSLLTVLPTAVMAQTTTTNPLSVRRQQQTTTTAKDTTTKAATPSRGAFTLPGAGTTQPATQQRTTTTPPPVPTTQTPTTRPATTTPAAQPKAQTRATEPAQKDDGTQISVRAQMGYTMQRELPASPVWKREVYRTLDLALPENAGLADPLTPTDTRMNLFTLIFKLLADKKIPAYEYTLDGNEQLDNAHRADFKDVLDRYHVYYRRKVVAATKDTVFAIDNSDIPSAEVQSYYIKEVYYYDRNSSSFHTAVEAICPRLHRAGDFDLNTVTYPMFWIQVSDLTPYLNLVEIPVSEYNNAATVRLDAYFAMQMYKGDIYKTNNPGGKTLSQIAPTDSLMAQERARIEAQLNGVESALWHNQTVPATAADSTQAAAPKAADSKAQNRRAPAATTKQESTSAARPAAAPSAPKASVRRERR